MTATRRWAAAGAAVLAALTLMTSGCAKDTHPGNHDQDHEPDPVTNEEDGHKGGGETGQTRLLGDGSTAVTGAQPNQPRPRKLVPGEKPPQFVVFSWDGAGEDGNKLFSHFREVAKENDAAVTYFLSGLYLLPEKEAKRYRPPGRPAGTSDIGYLKDRNIRATLEQLRLAWLDGSEIGTHFNGHFCGPTGVGSWSTAQWKSEIRQAKWMVSHWKTTTKWKELQPLPFDYGAELVGGRTPCLEGRANLLPAAKELGFRYDSSGNGTQVWPRREGGLWDLPLQQVPVPGRAFETLSMDYNFLVNQSGTVNGPVAKRPAYRKQMYEGLMRGFERAYQGNRAPMILGNHFEDWNGGIYMKAIEDVMKRMCGKAEVRCVSFRQLVEWLDAQDPDVLARLRTLEVGEKPEGGWKSFLTRPARRASPSPGEPAPATSGDPAPSRSENASPAERRKPAAPERTSPQAG